MMTPKLNHTHISSFEVSQRIFFFWIESAKKVRTHKHEFDIFSSKLSNIIMVYWRMLGIR